MSSSRAAGTPEDALGISTLIACCLATCSPANRKNVKMQKITSISGTSSIRGSWLVCSEFIFIKLGVEGDGWECVHFFLKSLV